MESAKGTVRTANLTTQATLICGPSERRVSLVFSAPVSPLRDAYYTISTEPGMALGGGINMLSTTGPVTISAAVHGDAVHRAWYAVGSVSMTIGYLETVVV